MNKTIIAIFSIIVIMTAVFMALKIYNSNYRSESGNTETEIAKEDIWDDCNDEYEEIQEEMLQASTEQEKISPNCFMTLEVQHKKCGHKTSEYIKIPEKLVNKTKEELQEQYNDWNIKEFSDTNIVLTKEEDGGCGEHYLVQDKDGSIVIYEILEDGTKKEYEKTDISTEYLSDSDRIEIKEGININGKQNLNQLIEDFE